MKTLTLLRHAKSSWDDSVPRDFDRPLNRKGERAAAAVGRHLKAEGLVFDHVIASPAQRCVETFETFRETYGAISAPTWDKRIYLASCMTLLDLVHEVSDGVDRLLLVGHNPGLEDLALLLVPESDASPLRATLEEKFPTASVAEIGFAVDHWRAVDRGGGTLQRFIRPRDLDPALGPGHD